MRPSFAFEGEKRGRYCVKHKWPTMVDVVNKHCEAAGCKVRSRVADKTGGRGQYCARHGRPSALAYYRASARGLPGARATRRRRRCDIVGCLRQARFGTPGARVSRCQAHRGPNMVTNPTLLGPPPIPLPVPPPIPLPVPPPIPLPVSPPIPSPVPPPVLPRGESPVRAGSLRMRTVSDCEFRLPPGRKPRVHNGPPSGLLPMGGGIWQFP